VGMRIILAAIFLFFIYAAPAYSRRPSDVDAYEEKGKIIESVTPIREQREKNLHPFIRDTEEGTESPAIKSKIMNPGSKPDTFNSKPDAKGINLTFILIILAAFFLSYFFIRPKPK
jgi:hypothetical protein